VLSTLTGLAGWSYPLIVLLVAGDAIFPLIPGEFAVISGGVLASTGRLSLPLLIVAAAAGAMLGDTLAYLLGRGAGRLGIGRLLRQPRSRRALVWATERLHRRAVPVLVTARFIPGGRTVTTLVAGFLRVPPRRFGLAIAGGGPVWAGYAAALGYVAGRVTADRPWVGMLAAITVLTLAGLLAEATRRIWSRTRRRASPAAPLTAAGGADSPEPIGAAGRPVLSPLPSVAGRAAPRRGQPLGSSAARPSAGSAAPGASPVWLAAVVGAGLPVLPLARVSADDSPAVGVPLGRRDTGAERSVG
jgi:membrane protein DedA with SNARE-associated domain